MADPSPDAPRTCPPCRGTGALVSNLGGSTTRVPCPWCGGSGDWNPEGDAQARFRPAAGDGS